MAGRAAHVITNADEETGDGENLGAEVMQALSPQPQTQQPAPNGAGAADQEFDIVEVDDQGRPIGGPQADEDYEEENLADGQGGNRPQIGEDGQTKTQVNRQRRAKNKEARQRIRAEASQKRFFESENAELRARLARLEGFAGKIEPKLNELDQGRFRDQEARVTQDLATAARDLEDAETRIRDAMMRGPDGADDLLVALRTRDQAFVRHARLESAKAQLAGVANGQAQQDRQPRQQQAPQPYAQPQPQTSQMDPQVAAHFNRFIADNSDWYDPKGKNEESAIAIAICDAMASEGFDMRDPKTWDELNERIQDRLPEVFEERAPAQRQTRQASRQQPQTNGNVRQLNTRQTQQPAPQRRGPMVGGAGERSNGNRQRFELNPARREALINANALGPDGRTVVDKEKFNRYIRSYQEYDRENQGAAR